MKIPARFLSLLALAAATLTLAAPSAEARGMAEIRDSKSIIFAINGNLPPFQYVVGGATLGYEIELAKMVAKDLGVEAVFVPYPALTDGIKALADGKADVLMSTLALTSTRDKKFDLTIPYACLGAAIATTDPNLKTGLDMKGKRISVLKGSAFESYLSKMTFEKTMVSHPTQPAQVEAVLKREVDGVITWKAMIPHVGKLWRVPLQDTPVLWSIPVGMLVEQGNYSTRLALNGAISRVQKDPRYAELGARYVPGEKLTCTK